MAATGGYDTSDPEGPTRGYIDGCFDIMHSGHYNAIRQAKCICDTLVVGIHSDTEIEENKALPVMKQPERYALLDHIKWIDEILYDVPYSPELATIERARADFCVHGDDMPVNAQGFCAYDEMRLAGKLRIVARTEGVSTTDMIGRLLTLSRHQHGPARASSPMGIRVGAEQAIQQLASMPDPRSRAESKDGLPPSPISSPLNARSLATSLQILAEGDSSSSSAVENLITKYGISADDADLLRKSCTSAECAKTTGEAASSEVRAKAPVQLLASTRRLVEFASSRQPTKDDRIVYVSGSFDMFHVGHAQFLKDAKASGTFLLVGVQEDITVRNAKGPSFPVMNLTERVLNVCACKWVDEVIIGAPKAVTEDIVKTWGIHVVAQGSGHQKSMTLTQDIDYFKVPKEKGMYVQVPSKWPDICHDTIVQRIISSRQSYLKRNKDRAKREDDYYDKKADGGNQEFIKAS